MTLFRALAFTAIALSTAGLSACAKTAEAPMDVGVCYAVTPEKDGKLTFNKVADKQDRIENCAIELERMRLRFLSLGGQNREVMGAYQGNFLWDGPAGVFYSQTLKGHPYSLLTRGDDGRLIIPNSEPATPAKP